MRIAGALLAVSLVVVGTARAEPPSTTPGPASGPAARAASPAASAPAVPSEASDATEPPAPAAAQAAPPALVPEPDEATAADLAAARAAAPDTASAGPPLTRPGSGRPAPTEVTIDQRNAFVAGVRFGGPTGATVRLSLLHGLGADVREKDERVDAVCSVPIPHCAGGFLLDAEAGSGGGKLSLGIGANAKIQDEDFQGTVGAGLKLSLTRTWGSPIGTDPGLTYLGPELDLYVLRLGVNLGVLWRIAGDGGSSALFSWGLGIRL
jgi:hypothetical protein